MIFNPVKLIGRFIGVAMVIILFGMILSLWSDYSNGILFGGLLLISLTMLFVAMMFLDVLKYLIIGGEEIDKHD